MYLFLYIVMNIIFFTVFLNIENFVLRKNIIFLSDLYGLNLYSSEASKHLGITILSMSGLPPLGGFIGKLFLYLSIIEARLEFILLISLIISLISTYYYLNFIRYIFFEKKLESKLNYHIKKIELTLISRFFSLFLITFPIYLNIYIDFFLKLSFSSI